jgi:protocatechuate 3,4-dioxygenase beta subunit
LVATFALPRRLEQVRRPFLAAILMIAIPAAPGAQDIDSLRGRVVDQAGRPVPYAQVEILPADRRVVTTTDGEFPVADLPDGNVRGGRGGDRRGSE